MPTNSPSTMKHTALFLLLNISGTAFTQTGANDPYFNPFDIGSGSGEGLNDYVECIVEDSQGRLLVGGRFTQYNGNVLSHIARFSSIGRLDTTFHPPTYSNTVTRAALQPDGKILVAALFNQLERLQPDGEPDSSFSVSFGNGSTINDILVQQDGGILVAGSFSYVNGQSVGDDIVRLQTDGSLDQTFDIGEGSNSMVYDIESQNGQILVAGNFSDFDGVAVGRIARLNADGSLDGGFTSGSGFNSTVYSIRVDDVSGKLVVVGDFSMYGSTSRSGVARLNANGQLDGTFNPGSGFDDGTSTCAIQADGKVVVGGNFGSFNGIACQKIARLNSNGSFDVSYGSASLWSAPYTMCLQGNGRVVVGGYLRTCSGFGVRYMARLLSDGSIDPSFASAPGFSGTVFDLAFQADGKIIACGEFLSYNGFGEALLQEGICRIATDGTLDTSFNTHQLFDEYRKSVLALQPDGKVLVGGQFYNPTSYLARLSADGSLDQSFNAFGPSDDVNAILVRPDGRIVMAGDFTYYATGNFTGEDCGRIIQANADGSVDVGFAYSDGGFNGTVTSMGLRSDGKVVVVGAFTQYNGLPAPGIAVLNTDGSADTGFAPGTGFDYTPQKVLVLPDDDMLIGGFFTSYNNSPSNFLARIGTNGVKDNSFAPSIDGNVTELALQPDGRIMVAGQFYSIDGTLQNSIARLNADGSLDDSFDTGTGFANGGDPATTYALLVQDNGDILVAGDFTSFNGVGRNRIARLVGDFTTSAPTGTLSTPIDIAPNPTSGECTLALDHVAPIDRLTIHNATGQLVQDMRPAQTDRLTLDLSNEASGLYTVRIMQGAQHTKLQVMVQH